MAKQTNGTLPESIPREYRPYVIPATGVGLVLSDEHIPFHDKKAMELAVRYGRRRNVSWVLLNGDNLDCQGPSRFVKKPSRHRFQQELELGIQWLTYLREKFPDAVIIWKDGNHEERLMVYLCTKAEEFHGLKQLTWPSLLEFDNLGIEYVTEKRRVKAGKLNVIHGHEYAAGISAPVNPARGLFLRAKGVALCGHYHQTSEHHEPTIDDKAIGCWSTGCLCELKPEWLPLNKWNHGFATVEFDEPDGDFVVQNLKIRDGKLA